jgi:4,5-dihydroxyphthalate decarboxylase
MGKRVGLAEFQQTATVWVRGILQHEYGVPVEKVTWVTAREETVAFPPPPKVRVEAAPPGVSLDELLVRGEIQALFLPRVPRVFVEADPRVARLFPDAKTEEVAYFRRNGFYPIMHVVALKEEVLQEHPWVAGNLMAAFAEAKRLCRGYYSDPNWSFLAWTRLMVEEQKELLGADPWPDTLSGNRMNLERFATYSFEQGLIPQKLPVDSLFAETTRDS